MAESEKITGTIAEMTQKATYWSCKLMSEGKNLTFNTKADPNKGSKSEEYHTEIEPFKPGDVVEIEYNRSVVPGRFDENGKPIEMKWIRNLKHSNSVPAHLIQSPDQLGMFRMIKEMHAVICPQDHPSDNKYENLSKKDDVFEQPEELDLEDIPM